MGYSPISYGIKDSKCVMKLKENGKAKQTELERLDP